MGESRWIVLIDKTPRGPLTLTEVRTLMEQRIVRSNDLACKLEESEERKKTEWKFLWQYPEFDRRREKKTETSQPTEERREQKNAVAIEETKKKLLPEELDGIHPEDLSYRTARGMPGDKEGIEHPNIELHTAPTISQLKQFNWKAFSAIPIMAFAGFFAFELTKSKDNDTFPDKRAVGQAVHPVAPSEPPPNRGISSSDPLSNARPAPERPAEHRDARGTAPATAMPRPAEIPQPAERDQGEVSYEEYRRRQLEQLEKERQAEEDRMLAEELGEDAPAGQPKKKRGYRPKKAAAEDENGDPLEETIEEDVAN